MAVIDIKNADVSENVQTFLSQEYTSGTTLYVDSSTAFKNGQYIVVGEPGLENTEVVSLTATPPTNTSLTVSSLKFSHPRGTPIFYCPWDKYSLEYKTTPSGSFSAYPSMPLPLNYDAIATEYRDTSATSTYQWRYRLYSSENSVYSDYSDTITSTGWPKNSVGYMVRSVRKLIVDPDSKTVSDLEIIRYFNAAQDKIYTLYDRWWFLFKVGSVISTVTDQKVYNLPSDFGRMHSVLFNFTAGSTTDITYNLRYLPMVEFDYASRDNTAASQDEIKYYTLYPGDSSNAAGYLYLWPKPLTAGMSVTPRYYKVFTSLDSYADTTEVPIPSILEDYAIAQIFKIRQEEAKANSYENSFKQQIELLKLMQRKQVGQPRHLWKWEGRRADERHFGTRTIYSDQIKENEF